MNTNQKIKLLDLYKLKIMYSKNNLKSKEK